jgi:hypothetical protein
LTGNMAVEIAARSIGCSIVAVSVWRIPYRSEPRQEKIAISLLQPPDELQNERIDQQPALHSGGSGIRSNRVLNSSKDSQRL